MVLWPGVVPAGTVFWRTGVPAGTVLCCGSGEAGLAAAGTTDLVAGTAGLAAGADATGLGAGGGAVTLGAGAGTAGFAAGAGFCCAPPGTVLSSRTPSTNPLSIRARQAFTGNDTFSSHIVLLLSPLVYSDQGRIRRHGDRECVMNTLQLRSAPHPSAACTSIGVKARRICSKKERTDANCKGSKDGQRCPLSRIGAASLFKRKTVRNATRD